MILGMIIGIVGIGIGVGVGLVLVSFIYRTIKLENKNKTLTLELDRMKEALKEAFEFINHLKKPNQVIQGNHIGVSDDFDCVDYETGTSIKFNEIDTITIDEISKEK